MSVAEVLRHDLRMPALERPADHSGDERSSMHQVTLTETQCRLLLAVIQRAKESRQFTCDTRKRAGRLRRKLRRIAPVAGHQAERMPV